MRKDQAHSVLKFGFFADAVRKRKIEMQDDPLRVTMPGRWNFQSAQMA